MSTIPGYVVASGYVAASTKLCGTQLPSPQEPVTATLFGLRAVIQMDECPADPCKEFSILSEFSHCARNSRSNLSTTGAMSQYMWEEILEDWERRVASRPDLIFQNYLRNHHDIAFALPFTLQPDGAIQLHDPLSRLRDNPNEGIWMNMDGWVYIDTFTARKEYGDPIDGPRVARLCHDMIVAETKQYSDYLSGNVYVVSIEQMVQCHPCRNARPADDVGYDTDRLADTIECDDDDDPVPSTATWETVDSVGGYYGTANATIEAVVLLHDKMAEMLRESYPSIRWVDGEFSGKTFSMYWAVRPGQHDPKNSWHALYDGFRKHGLKPSDYRRRTEHYDWHGDIETIEDEFYKSVSWHCTAELPYMVLDNDRYLGK